MVMKKRSNIFIATLVALFSFVTVVYMSCTTPGNTVSCSGSTCVNGGYCRIDTTTHKPACTCPTGYEGTNCSTVSVSKFLGNWNLRQIIVGSDSVKYNNDTTYYPAYLKAASTPTTFFIDNFFNDPYYNNIICTLDSAYSSYFVIDTISSFHMITSTFLIRGGYGSIKGDTINALLYIQFKNQTSNWQIDTINFYDGAAITVYNISILMQREAHKQPS